MANYRQIHTKIWKDSWFLELEPEHKLLFIYLFSNERACLTGLYDLSTKVIAFECGLTVEQVHSGLQIFNKEGKAFYRDGWLWIPNLVRYNAGNIASKRVRTHIEGLIANTPDIELRREWIRHYNSVVAPKYPIHTVSAEDNTVCIGRIQEQEHEQEHEQEQEQEHEQEHEASSSSDFSAQAFAAFQNNIGLISGGTQADEIRTYLDELEERGVPDWFEGAIEIAVDQNKRSWAYVRGILRNCLAEGRPPVSRASPPGKPTKQLVTITDPDTGEPVEVEAIV